jgi:hypothetical protein
MQLDTHQKLLAINEIKQKQLLTANTHPPGQYQWWGNDTQVQYENNCRLSGPDWYWLARPVTYTVNSQNYRAPEWDQVAWGNSIVIYGCSLVFGDGVSDEDTVSSQLEKITGRPVINLGSGGTSPLWQLHNQTLVLKWFTEPWATITLWPCASRSLSYENTSGAHRWGSWNIVKNNWVDYWNRGTNPGTQLWMCREQSRRMHRRRWLDATFGPNVADLLAIKLFGPEYMSGPGARDLAHPGPGTLRAVAEYLADQLHKMPQKG